MRLNGTARPTARGFAIEAEQVFANCPKYLQKRELYESVPAAATGPVPCGAADELTPDQAEFVRAADTFFVATGRADGVDASHRGGNPGFVRVDVARRAQLAGLPGQRDVPDAGQPGGGPAGRTAASSTGRPARPSSSPVPRHTEYSDGGRSTASPSSEAVETPAASPLRWSAPEYSPANPDRGAHPSNLTA